MTCLSEPEATFLTLLDQYRKQHGLRPLSRSAILTDTARDYAALIANRDHWGSNPHQGPDGSTVTSRAAAHGYTASCGENLLYGQPTAEAAFKVWQESPPHNENMLSPMYTEAGVAIAVEPRWDYTGDVFQAACLVLGTGTSAAAVGCDLVGNEPPKQPTRPTPRPPKTHLPKEKPPRPEKPERKRERAFRRLLRRLGLQ